MTMHKAIFTAVPLALASLSLAGCGGEPAQPQAEEPTGVPGLEVSDARVVLPAVSGNPAAVYFDLAYNGSRTVALRRADVEGAGSTMMHEYIEGADGEMMMQELLPLVLNNGSKVPFEPGGKHLMAMDLSPELQAGGTTDVTLTVTGGGKVTVPAQILAAGDDR